MRVTSTLRAHAPEYLIEAWALGTFMFVACAAVVAIAGPDGLLRGADVAPLARRAAIGVAMGMTALTLVRSPWGQRSGAHMNPAVTVTYLGLGRIGALDACGYVLAQFAGGALGIGVAWAVFGDVLASPAVDFVATRPGAWGAGVAFAAEATISAVLMTVVLELSADATRAALTPYAVACLVALYITFEAPLSGMSMNPARSLASALGAGGAESLWIYCLAPPLGMAFAAWAQARRGRAGHCAKLTHPEDQPCIHCGHVPSRVPLAIGVNHHAQ